MTPPPVKLSASGTLNKMKAQFGKTWPNPWWPTGNSKYNDCAAAVSWALFGLKGDQPYYTVVSQLLSGIGGVHMGNAGLKAGDVIGFDWGYGNNYDHTEICVAVNRTAGTVTSRGTNSNPGDDMRDRTRSLKYVKSYARPNYSAFAGGDVKPISEGATMLRILHKNGNDQALYLFTGFDLRLCTSAEKEADIPQVTAIGPDGLDPYNNSIAKTVGKIAAKTLEVFKLAGYPPPSTGGGTDPEPEPGPEPEPIVPPSYDFAGTVTFDEAGTGTIQGTLDPKDSSE